MYTATGVKHQKRWVTWAKRFTFYWQRSHTLQVIINPGSLLTLIQWLQFVTAGGSLGAKKQSTKGIQLHLSRCEIHPRSGKVTSMSQRLKGMVSVSYNVSQIFLWKGETNWRSASVLISCNIESMTWHGWIYGWLWRNFVCSRQGCLGSTASS